MTKKQDMIAACGDILINRYPQSDNGLKFLEIAAKIGYFAL